ncbi:MAG: orotidine-5'-phosphate decarboxylase [Planctomycetota bacterium]|nr:orotidine-5'-phosphate decarboxylase [Planctomycetota bacterium]MSR38552.1 orotidine-5'-phosphate decarboxylase [Planctomycetota bacterium]
MSSFVQQLAERIHNGAAPIVIGLDPRIDALPQQVRGTSAVERIVAFYRAALPVIARHSPVVKPNIAFFECFGSAGYAAYETTCAVAHEHGLLVLGDIKRGDIGSTAEAYAEGHFKIADALTLHPYLGTDSVAPFLQHCRPERGGKAVFVLVRTSNKGAADFQDLRIGEQSLCDVVADAVTRWGRELPQFDGYSPVGAVVGATWPQELARLRARLPHSWLLLPGIGAQGGKVADLTAAFDRRGLGALINQSRGVMQAFTPDDAGWLHKIDSAAAAFAAECLAVARHAAHA